MKFMQQGTHYELYACTSYMKLFNNFMLMKLILVELSPPVQTMRTQISSWRAQIAPPTWFLQTMCMWKWRVNNYHRAPAVLLPIVLVARMRSMNAFNLLAKYTGKTLYPNLLWFMHAIIIILEFIPCCKIYMTQLQLLWQLIIILL